MKTTLQKLINKWEIETGSYIPNAPIYKAFIEEAKMFLSDEEEQIKKAYKDGVVQKAEGANHYYECVFGDNPEAGI